jgi:hypothetical protein
MPSHPLHWKIDNVQVIWEKNFKVKFLFLCWMQIQKKNHPFPFKQKKFKQSDFFVLK